jgi:hypothetical protein
MQKRVFRAQTHHHHVIQDEDSGFLVLDTACFDYLPFDRADIRT